MPSVVAAGTAAGNFNFQNKRKDWKTKKKMEKAANAFMHVIKAIWTKIFICVGTLKMGISPELQLINVYLGVHRSM